MLRQNALSKKKKYFFPLRQGVNKEPHIQFFLTHIIQTASSTSCENPAEGVIIIVLWSSDSKTFTACSVHQQKILLW